MATEVEARLKISAYETTAKAFNAVERRLKRVERMTRTANRQQRQVAAWEATSARANRALLLGGTALMGGLAAAGGVRGGLDTLTSYEDALIEIRKKGGLTEDQMHAIGKEAKALATSGEIAVPLDEILSAYERAAAAGLPMNEWRDFAALSAKAADAFTMSAEEVGNAAAGFKVGLGIPMSEMERYFDLINSLADSGISDESDIIKFLDKAGAGLKVFGLNAKEVAAYGATLLNLKMEPEVGARMMNALTSKLIAPENLGKKGFGAFREVVGDVKAFKKEIAKDPQGALRKFLDKLSKLDKFKRARLTGAIFGSEWSDEIARLLEGTDELDRNLKMAASTDWFGSLGKSYEMKLQALSSRWQLFKNSVSELAIDLGTMGMPGMEAGLETARDLVKQISEEIATFELKLDRQEIGEAETALNELIASVHELLGIDGEGSLISSFFRDMATIVNEIATGIKLIKDISGAAGNPQSGIDHLDPAELARRKAEYDAKVAADGKSLFGRVQDWTGMAGWFDSPAPAPVWPADTQRNIDALTANRGAPELPAPADTQKMLDDGPLPIRHAPLPGTEKLDPVKQAFGAPTPLPTTIMDGASDLHGRMNELSAVLAKEMDWWSGEAAAAWRGHEPPALPTPPRGIGSDAVAGGTAQAGQGAPEWPALPAHPAAPEWQSPPAYPVPPEWPAPADWPVAPGDGSMHGGVNMQFGSGPNVDALRQAMESGSDTITQAGTDAGATIKSAAQELRDAASSIGDQGREAAAAISAARISVPSMPSAPRAPNANLGTSMPNAGTPGG